jgi:hypothetical protein
LFWLQHFYCTPLFCSLAELAFHPNRIYFWVFYTLPYRKYLIWSVFWRFFRSFFWIVLMAYVFSDYSGTVKCKISIFSIAWPPYIKA